MKNKIQVPKPNRLTIYTDGSYRGKLRAGGYAALIVNEYGQYLLVGDGMMNTTISRMELSAIVTGLSWVNDGSIVTVVSDSEYVVNIINKWLTGWYRSGFVKANGTVVANQDLLMNLMWQISRMKRVKATHVYSHTNGTDPDSLANDICDHVAVSQAKQAYTACSVF